MVSFTSWEGKPPRSLPDRFELVSISSDKMDLKPSLIAALAHFKPSDVLQSQSTQAISQPTTRPANSQPGFAPSPPASPPAARCSPAPLLRQPKRKRSAKKVQQKRLLHYEASFSELQNSVTKTAETYFKDKTNCCDLVDIAVHLINGQPLEETVYDSLWKRSVDIFSKTDSKASRVRRLETGRAVLQKECLANDYADRLGMLLFRIELDEMILSVPDNKCRQGVGKATIAYEKYAKEADVSVEYVSQTRSLSRNYARLVTTSGPGILACLNGQRSRMWERGSVDVDLLLKFVKDKYPEREETFRSHDRLCAKAILGGLKAYGWENDEIIQSKGEVLTAVREQLVPRANPLGDLSHRINSHSDALMRALAAAATQRENTYQLQPMDSVRAAPITSSDAQSRLNREDCQAYQSPTVHTFPNANFETRFAFSSPRQFSIPHSVSFNLDSWSAFSPSRQHSIYPSANLLPSANLDSWSAFLSPRQSSTVPPDADQPPIDPTTAVYPTDIDLDSWTSFLTPGQSSGGSCTSMPTPPTTDLLLLVRTDQALKLQTRVL
ncbi:conserved hypothetical protein [Histoplasma capsulatum H143]|uniref:Uncharacterized protein n=1 Tax=Ajellomyces capsulatus (strain H143) TaxID=544712 RepID=C6HM09_AJECH|nr:conserved hypothetical protein [Histoplasma capsulatum H143]